jgi:cell division protein ZapA
MFAHVTVRILEKEYHVACPAQEKSDLLASAELLNSKMREIRDSGKVVGLDRVAVMAALNLADELIKLEPPRIAGGTSVSPSMAQAPSFAAARP